MALSLLLAVVSLGQADLSPEDITAVFMENALRAETLRVQSTVTKSATAAKAEYYRFMIASGAEALKQPNAPGNLREIVTRDTKLYQELLESLKTTSRLTCRQDYWSDRSNFQMRAPVNRKLGGPFTFETPSSAPFPDVEATRDEIIPEFSDIFIVSSGPATKGLVRIWEAQVLLGDRHSGRVCFKNAEPHFHFPPLALPPPEWGGIPNPIDELYVRFLKNGRAKILGEFNLDGVKTILIDVHVEGAAARAVNEHAEVAAARAFIDVANAGMPRRIEFFLGPIEEYQTHIGLCVDHPKLTPDRIVKDIVLEEIEDGEVKLIYPVSGIQQDISRSPSPGLALSKTQPEAAVHAELKWEVHSVEINRAMTEENFALAFPSSTVFVNQPTNEVLLTGDVEGYVERVIQASRGQKSMSFLSRDLLIAIGAVTVLLAVLVVVRMRRRKAN